MIRRCLSICSHELLYAHFYPTYRRLVKNQYTNYDELRREQEKKLRRMIKFAYYHVPFYHKILKNCKLTCDDINTLDDLKRLPIINKEIIKNNWDDFRPTNLDKLNHYVWATGGTSGTPLKYRISKHDRFMGAALMYRGWSYAGYKLGDKIFFLGGTSLGVDSSTSMFQKMDCIARNILKLSSFDMGQTELDSYISRINNFQPNYAYGYPSSFYFFSKWIEENNYRVYSPRAIFTTSEKLLPIMREKTQVVFGSEVYDTYGVNDGGISAFECSEHNGFHIDTERSILEVIDENDETIEEGEGKIIATSLYNCSMPLIRYETGDIGHLLLANCACGRQHKLLKEIIGRSSDMLISPEGKNIHGWFFLYIFWQYCKGIKEYQVVQETLEKITIKIVPEDDFDERQLDIIRSLVSEKSKRWILDFKIVDKIEKTKAGKYKFIENKIR